MTLLIIITPTFPEAEHDRHMGVLSLQNVFTSQVVLTFSYEDQLPEPNLFLTSRIFRGAWVSQSVKASAFG